MLYNKIVPKFGIQKTPTETPYVDDIFDPLFNKQVTDYYNSLYGSKLLSIPAAYAEMLDNALTGRKGILGPGMGILSTFGRSMDKADDFILGSLTEGVNAAGNLLGGTNEAPTNPITNIFRNDYDYTGTKLLAAMGNSMAKLAGTTTPLTEENFNSFGDRVAGTMLDLATDPGYTGGKLAALNPNTPVGQVGQYLSKYDDIMADVAGNMAFPGGKALVSKNVERLFNYITGSASSKPYKDTVIKTNVNPAIDVTINNSSDFSSSGTPDITDDMFNFINNTSEVPDEVLDAAAQQMKDMRKAGGLNPMENPEAWKQSSMVIEADNIRKASKTSKTNTPPSISQIINERRLERLKEKYNQQEDLDKLLKNATDTQREINEDINRGVKSGVIFERGTVKSDVPNIKLNATIYNILENADGEGIPNSGGELFNFYKLRSNYSSPQEMFEDILEGNVPVPTSVSKAISDLRKVSKGVTTAPSKSNFYLTHSSADYAKRNNDILTDAINTRTKKLFSKRSKDLVGLDTSTPEKAAKSIRTVLQRKLTATSFTNNEVPTILNRWVGQYQKLKLIDPHTLTQLRLKSSIKEANAIKAWYASDNAKTIRQAYENYFDKPFNDIFKDTSSEKWKNLDQLYDIIAPELIKANKETIKTTQNFNDALNTLLSKDPKLRDFIHDIAVDRTFIPDIENVILPKKGTSTKQYLDYFSNSKGTGIADIILKNKRWISNMKEDSFDKDLITWAEDVQELIAKGTSLKSWDESYALSGFDTITKYYDFNVPNTTFGYNKLASAVRSGEVKLRPGRSVTFSKDFMPNTVQFLKDTVPYSDKTTVNINNLTGEVTRSYSRVNESSIINDKLLKDYKTTVTLKMPSEKYNEYLKLSKKDGWLKNLMDKFKATYSETGNEVYLKVPRDSKAYKMLQGLDFTNNTVLNNEALSLFSDGTKQYFTPPSKFIVNNKIYDTITGVKANAITENTKKITPIKQEMKVNELTETVKNTTPKVFADTIVDPQRSTQSLVVDNLITDTFGDYMKEWNLPPEQLENHIKIYGTPKQKTLFQLLSSEIDTKLHNKAETRRGAERLPQMKELKEAADKLNKKYINGIPEEYLNYKSTLDNRIVKGNDMLTYLADSNGWVSTRTKDTKLADSLYNQIKTNVDTVNSKLKEDVLKIVDVKHKDGSRTIGYAFNTDNKYIKKHYNKLAGLFSSNLQLQDMVFGNKGAVNVALDAKYKDLDEFFDKVRQMSEYLSTKMGFTTFNDNYIKYAMASNQEAAQFFTDYAGECGVDLDKLGQITDALKDFRQRGSFGTYNYNRSYLGDFSMYSPGYSKDINYILSSTFTKGTLDNTDAQTFMDLFLSKNFSLSENFDSVETLKKALRSKDDHGNYYGNITNLDVLAPKYNSDGRVVGFIHYDKFNDLELEKAFKNGEAILAPDSVISELDAICKRDKRLSNRFVKFMNKYLTVPFKFATLCNPGFLVGNIQDAYFKQAAEMAKKYGTSMSEELANVAMSMRQVTTLNNQFADAFDEYLKFLKSDKVKGSEIYGKSIAYAKSGALTPAIVMNNPDHLKAWTDYLNTMSRETPEQLQNWRVSKLYTFLNVRQNTATFTNNNNDLADVFKAMRENPYDVPLNSVERVFYGDKNQKGFKSWGLFVNNPVGNTILEKSNQIEVWMRSASILNDLKHQGFDNERIISILALDPGVERKMLQELKIQMDEATNSMNAINFGYDKLSPVLEKMSYVIPFPTFYLKNIGYWADMLSKNPQMIDNVISIHENMWAGKDTSKDEFAAEAKGRGAVPINKLFGNKHLTGIVKQTPYNSMFGAFNAVNNLKEDMAYRFNPALRPITRHLQDPEDIKYRPYSTNVYEKNIKQDSPQFSELSYMFHQLNPYERAINTGLRTPKKIATNDYQLSDFLPSMFQPDFSKK